jgi:DNA (cytosine-5)-methyltransferase 1
MSQKFAIVDLFAGPGGLAEGFASIRDGRGRRPFGIALSVEKDPAAHQTLLLRAFLRRFEGGFPGEYYHFLNGNLDEPDWATLYPAEWKAARDETLMLELGTPQAWSILEGRFAEIQRSHGGNIILIGGPPCQAYSLVGRARNKGVKGYEASKDHRHFLYREYIRILDRLKPVAFVMENVKGMLSSSVDGERVFDQVLDDLGDVGQGAYSLFPLRPRSRIAARIGVRHPPATDFVVRAEDLGIPQARHRVIVVGIAAMQSVGLMRMRLPPAFWSSRMTPSAFAMS